MTERPAMWLTFIAFSRTTALPIFVGIADKEPMLDRPHVIVKRGLDEDAAFALCQQLTFFWPLVWGSFISASRAPHSFNLNLRK
jgi:hypothetical protein